MGIGGREGERDGGVERGEGGRKERRGRGEEEG